MDVMEKLVELVNDVLQYLPWGEIQKDTAERIADRMVDHGVTAQKWISVKDRLPDKQGNYLTYDPRYRDIEIYYYMGFGEWDHHRNGTTDAEGHGFTHWTPLPQPPKGE